MKDANDKLIHENLYWLTNEETDWQLLDQLQSVTPKIVVQDDNKSGRKRAVINNSSNETAFFIRIKVTNKQTGELALPVFAEDNYFTLFPGEKKEVWIDLSQLPKEVNADQLLFEAEAWNSPATGE